MATVAGLAGWIMFQQAVPWKALASALMAALLCWGGFYIYRFVQEFLREVGKLRELVAKGYLTGIAVGELRVLVADADKLLNVPTLSAYNAHRGLLLACRPQGFNSEVSDNAPLEEPDLASLDAIIKRHRRSLAQLLDSKDETFRSEVRTSSATVPQPL